jgi:hypothetical protein
MQSATQAALISTKRLWTGRVISTIVILFLLFDAIIKLIKVAPVLQAFERLGYPPGIAVAIGSILLACVVVYSIPRTSILGAILLTAYLGGATASQMRISAPLFETLFPVIFAVLMWAGIFLRDSRLSAIIPLRS